MIASAIHFEKFKFSRKHYSADDVTSNGGYDVRDTGTGKIRKCGVTKLKEIADAMDLEGIPSGEDEKAR